MMSKEQQAEIESGSLLKLNRAAQIFQELSGSIARWSEDYPALVPTKQNDSRPNVLELYYPRDFSPPVRQWGNEAGDGYIVFARRLTS